jgi:hypothetical protein
VVDCSVAARWLLPDGATAYTDSVFALLGEQDAVVPLLFVLEFSKQAFRAKPLCFSHVSRVGHAAR